MLLASQILRKVDEHRDLLGDIKVPKTWYIASDGLQSFAEHNQLEDVYNRKYLEIEQVRREYPHIVQVFKNSSFAPEILKGLSAALDDLGDGRSSSAARACSRTGWARRSRASTRACSSPTRDEGERLNALTDAIAEVYASIFGPDPIEYRAERNLLDLHEEMGIMIQEVVGARVGPYFMPAFAGVAFSHNEFRWSPRIRGEDGLVRLVPGLGTRAVDRVGDDYPVLVAPGQPGLRVNVTTDEILRYAPARADVINLETREFETVEVCGPAARVTAASTPPCGSSSSRCWTRIPDARGFRLGLRPGGRPVVTFEAHLGTPFMARMRTILRCCARRWGCRWTSSSPATAATSTCCSAAPRASPRIDAAPARSRATSARAPALHRATASSPTAASRTSRTSCTSIPAVRPAAPPRGTADVGRAVGRLNKLLPRRQFVLMGPGRWGSRGDIKLGVSVTYSDINNTAVLMEIAARRGSYVPDLSFGTHFFQDLVEAGIRYLPLFPGDGGPGARCGVPAAIPQCPRRSPARVRAPRPRGPRRGRGPGEAAA
jgi:pyruvate, water dikinase